MRNSKPHIRRVSSPAGHWMCVGGNKAKGAFMSGFLGLTPTIAFNAWLASEQDALVDDIMKDRPKCDPTIYGEVVAKFLDAKDEQEIRRDLTPVAKKLEPMTDAEREDRWISFLDEALIKHMAPEVWARIKAESAPT